MSQFIQTFLTGGFMMWPLLAASIVTIAIAVERTVFYRRSASDMQVLQGEFLSAVRSSKHLRDEKVTTNDIIRPHLVIDPFLQNCMQIVVYTLD